jgi:hypothetical protein
MLDGCHLPASTTSRMLIHRTLVMAAGALAAASVVVACGSSSPTGSSSTAGSSRPPAQAGRSALGFARCMRSHRVSNFPDPASGGGGFSLNVPGINPASPVVKAAETACQHLLPVKRPSSQAPTAQAYIRLLHWTRCMRAHGIPGMPDPKPDPVPAPNSPGSRGIGTLMGDGGYWVGIPSTTNAHSPAFTRLSARCGESTG